MKKIRIAEKRNWQKFLALAETEGWRVPQVECQLFQGIWLHQAQILEEGQNFCGLVTAVPHQYTGWIGNLIVPSELRGRGYGSQLFTAAFAALEEQGVRSVWLTASKIGQTLYEKHGFAKVDEVERWVSSKRKPSDPFVDSTTASEASLRKADQRAWGEERQSLLNALVTQGKVFACHDTVALLQQEPGLQIIGPWYSPPQCPRSNRLVLQKILAAAHPKIEIVADMLASSPVRQLLLAAGFNCVGSNALMVKGDASEVDLSMMVSLASLGSVG